MDAIKAAVLKLQNVPSKTWRGNKDAEDAVSQVSSITRLFELPAASTATFTRLRQILRTKLLPLYRAALPLALEITSAILVFLHNKPQIPAHTSDNAQTSCETLLVALVSAILDYVEENSNIKTRETVASALYPILCPAYILRPFESSSRLHLKVAPLVYQTFTATAESCPKNAAKLRDQYLNCRNLGYTISITQEFLTLEALLDLFGILIPPAKGSRAARSRFFSSVFTPEFYGDTSKKIVQHLETIATPEWSVTSREILKMLAKSNITYPQPLEGNAFQLNSKPIEGCTLFYIDKSQLIANIDKARLSAHTDGDLDTLHIPLSTIISLKTSSEKITAEANVVFTLSKPPVLGETVMTVNANQDIKFAFTIKVTYLPHLESVLQHRKVVPRQLGARKLSKGQPIVLDASAPQDIEELKLTQQERLQEVSVNILTSPQATERGGKSLSGRPSLSPVIRKGGKSAASKDVLASLESTPKRHQTRSATKAILPSTVFVGSDGHLSLENPKLNAADFQSKDKENVQKRQDIQPEAPVPKKAAKPVAIKNPAPQPNLVGRKGKVELHSKKTKPIALDPDLSDKDEEDPFPESPVLVSRALPVKPRPARPTTTAVAKAKKDDDSKKRKEVEEKKKEEEATSPSPLSSPVKKEAVKKRNRRFVLSESSDSDDADHNENDAMEVDEPPAKKARLGQDPPILSSSLRTYKKPLAKYGRKGRTSSPAPAAAEAANARSIFVDFDQVPTSDTKSLRSAAGKRKAPEESLKRLAAGATGKGKAGKENVDVDMDMPVKKEKGKAQAGAKNVEQQKVNEQAKVARGKQKDEEEVKKKEIKLKTPVRTLSARPANEAVKADRAPQRVTRQSTKVSNKQDMSDPITVTSSPEKIPEAAPWDNLNFSSDPAPLDGSIDNDNDTCTGKARGESKPETPDEMEVESDLSSVMDEDLGFMEAIEEPPPIIDIQDVARAVVSEPWPLKSKQRAKPQTLAQVKPRPSIQPVYVKKEPTMDVIDLTTHASTTSPEPVEEGKEDKAHIFMEEDNSERGAADVRMASPDGPDGRRKSVTPPPALRPPPEAAVQPIKVKEPAPEPAPRKMVFEKLSILKTPEAQIGRLAVLPPRAMQRETVLQPLDLFKSVRNKSPVVQQRLDIPIPREQAPLNREEVTPPRREFTYSRPEQIRSRRQEIREDPMNRIVQILAELNHAVLNRIERRFDGISQELTSGQRIILEGTASTLQEMHQDSVAYFNQMVDMEEQYTSCSSRIFNAVHDLHKSSEQLSRCLNAGKINHGRQTLSKKLPPSLFPKIPATISNPVLKF